MVYINNVHIVIYILLGIMGAFTGYLAGWANKRLPEYKKIFSKDLFVEKVKPNVWLMIINAMLNILLLYKFGIQTEMMNFLQLIQYLILIPMLLCVFCIDYKLTIIPNRLNLTLFEIGLAFTFIYGVSNFKLAEDSILGMIAGGGIFLIISWIGGIIAGKEAMGFGDVKLMGALGLFFGLQNTIVITVLAFLVGAIISIVVMIVKKSLDQYIPFGPFIVIGTIITMLVHSQWLIHTLITIFSLGLAH